MANRRRGEIEAVIDGEPVTLCLTLGALCELEAAFGAADLAALGERFATGRLAARDLTRILACALRGGGRAVSDAEVDAMRFDGGLTGLVRIVAELLEATFGAEAEGGGGSGPPPKVPGTTARPSPGTS